MLTKIPIFPDGIYHKPVPFKSDPDIFPAGRRQQLLHEHPVGMEPANQQDSDRFPFVGIHPGHDPPRLAYPFFESRRRHSDKMSTSPAISASMASCVLMLTRIQLGNRNPVMVRIITPRVMSLRYASVSLRGSLIII
jgi:hypothetical protein